MPTLNMALPANTDKHTDKEIRSFYDFKNIAIVGMSTNEGKPAHFVPKYLLERGFNVVPVNPTASEILGRKSRHRHPRATFFIGFSERDEAAEKESRRERNRCCFQQMYDGRAQASFW